MGDGTSKWSELQYIDNKLSNLQISESSEEVTTISGKNSYNFLELQNFHQLAAHCSTFDVYTKSNRSPMFTVDGSGDNNYITMLDKINIDEYSIAPYESSAKTVTLGTSSAYFGNVYCGNISSVPNIEGNSGVSITSSGELMGSNTTIQSGSYFFNIFGNDSGTGLTFGNYNGAQFRVLNGALYPNTSYNANTEFSLGTRDYPYKSIIFGTKGGNASKQGDIRFEFSIDGSAGGTGRSILKGLSYSPFTSDKQIEDTLIGFDDWVSNLRLNLGGSAGVQLNGTGSTGVIVGGGYMAPSKDNLVDLGSSSGLRWKTIYAVNGTIQTSSRKDKHDIHYIASESTKARKASADSAISENSLLSFIESLNPATFIYNTKNDDAETVELSEDEALEQAPETIQLGLIADDIRDDPLFRYVGMIKDVEEKDESGEVISTSQTLGLKPIPLAVLALTACKNLLKRVRELENKQ